MPNKKELAKMAAEAEDKDEDENNAKDEDEVMIWEYEDGSFHISPREIQQMNEDLILDRPRSLD
jgi:hypothetical protein